MTTTTKTTSKRFELDGTPYVMTPKGYCYRDNVRIRKEQFEAALREYEAQRKAPEGVREDINFSIDIDGHHYVQDWAAKKYYRDGEQISKRQWDRVMDGKGFDPDADRPRTARKKDVAFEHEGVTLTSKQEDFLRELSLLSEDVEMGSARFGWYCDVIVEAIGGQFKGRAMTVGAMISTICEKGLAVRSKVKADGRRITAFDLTDLGRSMWAAMGLKGA